MATDHNSGMALTPQWRHAAEPDGRGLAQSGHLRGCACCGGFGAGGVEPAAIERELLDWLAQRYRAQGRAALHDLVYRRIALREIADPGAFDAWLAALDTAPLAPEDRALLMADIGRALAPFACS